MIYVVRYDSKCKYYGSNNIVIKYVVLLGIELWEWCIFYVVY